MAALRLVMSIQPDEGIVQCFQAKYPAATMHLRSVAMQFNYKTAFAVQSPDAYETLLWGVMKNDATLFMRRPGGSRLAVAHAGAGGMS